MLHISICDDESVIAEQVKKLIQEELSNQQITAYIEVFSNGGEFLEQYEVRDNELIFLDMDMPVKSGMDVMKELEPLSKNKNIILLTNHDNLILESLSFCPFQCIRKKNMEKDIPKALRQYMKEKLRREEMIEFVEKGAAYHVKKEEIEYLEKYRHHVIVHLISKEPMTIRGKMQEYEVALSGSGFLRIHSGYIVNLDKCFSIEKNEMVLYSGIRLPISRDRQKLVKEQFTISRRD